MERFQILPEKNKASNNFPIKEPKIRPDPNLANEQLLDAA
jgi:hypothetical protein